MVMVLGTDCSVALHICYSISPLRMEELACGRQTHLRLLDGRIAKREQKLKRDYG